MDKHLGKRTLNSKGKSDFGKSFGFLLDAHWF